MGNELVLGAVLGGGIVALAWLTARAIAARLRCWRARRRARHAVRAEGLAEELLVRRGFEVLDRQCSTSWPLCVDGHPLETTLRADLLVRRGAHVYVAEVKTGVDAPSIRNVSTRRQLLEYFLAYQADGLLLVDADEERVFEVEFPALEPMAPKRETAARRRPLAWLIAWLS